MPTAASSTVVDAPVEEVWALVRSFDRLHEWHPSMPEASLSDGASPDVVGCVRTFDLGGTEIRERLVALDDEERTATYRLEKGTLPVRNYTGTISARPVTATGATFVEWSTRFDCEEAVEQEVLELLHTAVLGPGLAGLRDHFA